MRHMLKSGWQLGFMKRSLPRLKQMWVLMVALWHWPRSFQGMDSAESNLSVRADVRLASQNTPRP